MKIIAGLGNPGPKYEITRHNVGFLAIDRMIDDWKAMGPARTPSGMDSGEVWQTTVEGEKVILVKPMTYMNNSGRCIAPLLRFYKCASTDLTVIHDDLDLKPMALRIKTGGGAGGHNGLKSIDASLGAGQTGYHRIRIGIGRPEVPGPSVVDYVLQPFSDSELKAADLILDKVVSAARLLVRGEVQRAMNEYNGGDTPRQER